MPTSGAILLGLMSGTSADGLDIAICNVQSRHNISLIAAHHFPYPDALQADIVELQVSCTAATMQSAQLKTLDRQIACFVSESCKQAIQTTQLEHQSIAAIANHGQTILHQPNASQPFSLQIGHAQTIADNLNLPVISDFRTADIQAGGQGAPLMPAFHHAVFHSQAPCNILNIGGIANLTCLEKHEARVIGFDTGPGNTLLDQWNRLHNHTAFDKSGDWARSGNCHQPLLEQLLSEPYFSATPPKSTGQDLFNLHWLNQKIQSLPKHAAINANDIQHTLSQLTATSISQAIKKLNKQNEPLFLCGGGTHNTFLMEQLQNALPTTLIQDTSMLGIHPNWVEAMGFAWLGYCRLNNLPSNFPAVTGAGKPISLGQVTQPNHT